MVQHPPESSDSDARVSIRMKKVNVITVEHVLEHLIHRIIILKFIIIIISRRNEWSRLRLLLFVPYQ